jgi:hypothetical protein
MEVEASCRPAAPPVLSDNLSVTMSDSMEIEYIQTETPAPSSKNSSTFRTVPAEEQRNSAPLQSSFKSMISDSTLDVGGSPSSSYKAAPTSNMYDSMEKVGEEVVMDGDGEDWQVVAIRSSPSWFRGIFGQPGFICLAG